MDKGRRGKSSAFTRSVNKEERNKRRRDLYAERKDELNKRRRERYAAKKQAVQCSKSISEEKITTLDENLQRLDHLQTREEKSIDRLSIHSDHWLGARNNEHESCMITNHQSSCYSNDLRTVLSIGQNNIDGNGTLGDSRTLILPKVPCCNHCGAHKFYKESEFFCCSGVLSLCS